MVSAAGALAILSCFSCCVDCMKEERHIIEAKLQSSGKLNVSNVTGVENPVGYLGLDSSTWDSVGTALTLFNIAGDLRNAFRRYSDWSSADKYKFSADVMNNYDSLVALHNQIVDTVNFKNKSWRDLDCKNYQMIIGKGGVFMAIQNVIDTVVTNAGYEQISCTLHLAASVARIRTKLLELDKEVEHLVDNLKIETVNLLFEEIPHKGCDEGDGQRLTTIGELDEEQVRLVKKSDGSDTCVEVQEGNDVVKTCSEICRGIADDGCSGFTLYNGTLYHPETLLEPGADLESIISDEDKDGVYVELLSENQAVREKCFEQPVMIDMQRTRKLEKPCDAGKYRLMCVGQVVGEGNKCFGAHEFIVKQLINRREVLANKCCFRASTGNFYLQEATTCYTRPFYLEKANMKWNATTTADRISTALHARGVIKNTGEVKEAIESQRLNALALNALGTEKLRQYLRIGDGFDFPAEKLRQAKCVIDATIQDVEAERCLDTSFLENFDKYRAQVDPYVFWGAKNVAAGIPLDWSYSHWFGRLKWALSKVSGKLANATALSRDAISTMMSVYVNYKYIEGNSGKLYNAATEQDTEMSMKDVLPLIGAASFILQDTLTKYTESCPQLLQFIGRTGHGSNEEDIAACKGSRDRSLSL